jgi:small subunit ribosomal protein S8
MMTDPIADELTRMRNALRIRRTSVDIPHSKIKQGVAEALLREGFIRDFQVIDTKPRPTLRIGLKYGPNGEEVISYIQRTSKPGCRVYRDTAALKPVRRGIGITVVSTSKGILSDRECRKLKVGGEVLATVW